MSHDSIYAGELLVKLCELSRTNNVDIRVRQDSFNPNAFEIRLDRRDCHSASLIDITRTWIDEPERAADYVFHRSLYEIEKMDKHKPKCVKELIMNNTSNLPYTRDEKLNIIVTELMNDWNSLVEKAKSYGMDIRFAPNCAETLELYFHDDYPDMLLVDKYNLNGQPNN